MSCHLQLQTVPPTPCLSFQSAKARSACFMVWAFASAILILCFVPSQIWTSCGFSSHISKGWFQILCFFLDLSDRFYMSQTQHISGSTNPKSHRTSQSPKALKVSERSTVPSRHLSTVDRQLLQSAPVPVTGWLWGALFVSVSRRPWSFLVANAGSWDTCLESWLWLHPFICVTLGKLFNLFLSVCSSIKIGIIIVAT